MRIISSANGHRFDSERLRLFYILISFFGKSLIELLKKTLGFPCWRTTMRWKAKILEKYEINLDGTKDSLASILKIMHPDYLQDPRAVIATDAVSISPNVSVSIDSTVTGLISIDSLPLSETAEILKSPEDLANFVKQHADDVIK